jgi:hypothetical protein
MAGHRTEIEIQGLKNTVEVLTTQPQCPVTILQLRYILLATKYFAFLAFGLVRLSLVQWFRCAGGNKTSCYKSS